VHLHIPALHIRSSGRALVPYPNQANEIKLCVILHVQKHKSGISGDLFLRRILSTKAQDGNSVPYILLVLGYLQAANCIEHQI
jgi:hypothetical protein